MKTAKFLFLTLLTLSFNSSCNSQKQAVNKQKILYQQTCNNIPLLSVKIEGEWFIDSVFVNGVYNDDTLDYKGKGFTFTRDSSFSEIKKFGKSGYSTNCYGKFSFNQYEINVIDCNSKKISYELKCFNENEMYLMTKVNHKQYIYYCEKDLKLEKLREKVMGPAK